MQLLDAEMEDLVDKDGHIAVRHFESAILSARSCNIPQDEGIIRQRLGEFFLRRDKQNHAAKQLEAAVQLFESWGARAKGQQLRSKYQDILSPIQDIVVAAEEAPQE